MFCKQVKNETRGTTLKNVMLAVGVHRMMIKKSHRVALYLRVSTDGQTTANQEQELRAVADRKGCTIVKVYKDHGISGAKGRDKRPQFDAMHRDGSVSWFSSGPQAPPARPKNRKE